MACSKVAHDKKRRCFTYDGSYVQYEIREGCLDLIHTYTPPKKRGQGLAAKVVSRAFQYAEENDMKIIPTCTYIPVFVQRNPEYEHLLKH